MNLDERYITSREAALEMVVDSADFGIWEVFVDGNLATMHLDARTAAVVGLPPAEATPPASALAITFCGARNPAMKHYLRC